MTKETSINLDEAAKDSNGLFKKEEQIEKKVEEEQNLFKEEEIKLEDNNGLFKEKAPVDNEIQNTNQKKNIISKMIDKMIESFNKLIESATRTWNQDSGISPKKRKILKDRMKSNKAKLEELSNQLKALGDNPTAEQITKIESEIDNIKNSTAQILRTAENRSYNFDEIVRDTGLPYYSSSKSSTIYKDISKAIDDLGEEMATDIKNRVDENMKKRKELEAKWDKADYDRFKLLMEAEREAEKSPNWNKEQYYQDAWARKLAGKPDLLETPEMKELSENKKQLEAEMNTLQAPRPFNPKAIE